MRRHRSPTYASRAADVVAEPWSMAKNARGWLVTWLCYPALRAVATLGVVCDFLVRVLQTLDQLLDAEIVGQDLRCDRIIAAEYVMKRGIEEDHRTAAEGTVGATGLQKQDRGHGQAAQLNLARCLFNEVVAVLFRVALHLDQVRASPLSSLPRLSLPTKRGRLVLDVPPERLSGFPRPDLSRTLLRAWQPPRLPHSTPGVTCPTSRLRPHTKSCCPIAPPLLHLSAHRPVLR